MNHSLTEIDRGLVWCLAWGDQRQPAHTLQHLNQIRQSLIHNKIDPTVAPLVDQIRQLSQGHSFPETIQELIQHYPDVAAQNTRIGLVHGGATKIKSYVFEASKLQDIRGASALLDRINLIDLKAFFGQVDNEEWQPYGGTVTHWLDLHFPGDENSPPLSHALNPDLIIYSTGGNILALCPVAYVNDLANAIERRYTEETLTANSCAVGETFRLLEFRFGLLKDPIEQTPWLEWLERNQDNPIVRSYYNPPTRDTFEGRKSFSELVTRLAIRFNQRRGGQDTPDRSTRRHPPMFETHPCLRRGQNELRSAIKQVPLPGDPWFAETQIRKRISGQFSKNEKDQPWYKPFQNHWHPSVLESWTSKFIKFLKENRDLYDLYYRDISNPDDIDIKESQTLREIGDASTPKGFVGFIYADGNNMGGYINSQIKIPKKYQDFSKHILKATTEAVYIAIARHLAPHYIAEPVDQESKGRRHIHIHPFEIIAIGGDDVMLVVPADKALSIAKTLGEEFEKILINPERLDSPTATEYEIADEEQLRRSVSCHRYRVPDIPPARCKLSMSTGVLIIAQDTPIYYAQGLVEELLKLAKRYAKNLKRESGYSGGTVDFLVMKSVTMLSSSISDFRKNALVKEGTPNLKLYAAPYTLHDLGGLLQTLQALRDAEFPRSQLYQVRSLLEAGKHTAMLNYRYFRIRLSRGQEQLKEHFEQAWCKPKENGNNGNLAPWMLSASGDPSTYETIWRDLVDLYAFQKSEESARQPEEVRS